MRRTLAATGEAPSDALAVAAGADAVSEPVGNEAWPTIEKVGEVLPDEPSRTRKLCKRRDRQRRDLPRGKLSFGQASSRVCRSRQHSLAITRDEIGRQLKVDRVRRRSVQRDVVRERPLCRDKSAPQLFVLAPLNDLTY